MIKIVVDSASDITRSEAESLGVSLISMRVRFGEEEFSDGVDITHREFYEKLIESDALPQTSQINEFCWAERFDELLKDADEVLAITISSKLSGTYDSAVAAAKKFGTRVRVVDSLSACIGERILCMYALRLIRDHGIDDAERLLNEKKNKMHFALFENGRTHFRGDCVCGRAVIDKARCMHSRRRGQACGQSIGEQARKQSARAARGKVRRH